MKHSSNHPSERHLARPWRTGALAALILCAGFVVPSRGSAGGGETVGTLPGVGGGGFDIHRPFRDPSPSVFLEGTMQQINGVVLGWNGRAIVTEQVIDPSSQVVRLTFHGDFRLDLDRSAFEQGSVSIGWAAPQTAGSVRATMLLGARTLATGLVSERDIVLPVRQVDSSGGLDLAPLAIVTAGQGGLHASLDIAAHGDVLVLAQSH
jgi:hypothetical protein